MPSLDFADLIDQADRLRDSGQIAEAVTGYVDIATLALEDHEAYWRARAYHLAGVSARIGVKGKESSYYRDAFSYFRLAEETFRSLGDNVSLGALYRDMAVTADRATDYTVAPAFFQKAIELLTLEGAYGELAITYDKLGVHFYQLGQFNEAKEFITKALETFRQEPTAGFFRATTLLDSARLNFKVGQFEESLELADEALSWFEADHPGHNFAFRQTELHGLIGLVYRELSNKAQSERHLGQYQEILKTLDPLAIKAIEKDLENLAT